MMTADIQFLRVKTDTAPKTSLNAQGGVTYALLKDIDSTEAYFCLLANDGGGYFSREAVPFAAIEACLSGVNTERAIPAKVFRRAFVGRSVNNAGFLVHALRHERLLLPSPDAAHQHILAPDLLNDQALQLGGRLMSSYTVGDGVTIWLITDRPWESSAPEIENVTTFLMPCEY